MTLIDLFKRIICYFIGHRIPNLKRKNPMDRYSDIYCKRCNKYVISHIFLVDGQIIDYDKTTVRNPITITSFIDLADNAKNHYDNMR